MNFHSCFTLVKEKSKTWCHTYWLLHRYLWNSLRRPTFWTLLELSCPHFLLICQAWASLLDGEYPFSWFASLWLMKMDQSLLKLKLEVEERIKDLSGEHLNTYWEKLHYHNDTGVSGIRRTVCLSYFYFLKIIRMTSSVLSDAGSSLWQACPQPLTLCVLHPEAAHRHFVGSGEGFKEIPALLWQLV